MDLHNSVVNKIFLIPKQKERKQNKLARNPVLANFYSILFYFPQLQHSLALSFKLAVLKLLLFYYYFIIILDSWKEIKPLLWQV